MADTIRSEAQLLALFADNTSGSISAQDLRDFVVSAGVDESGGGEPASPANSVQFNDSGVFGGSSGFVADASGNVDIVGSLDVDNININGSVISNTSTNAGIILAPNGTGAIQIDAAGNARGQNAIDLQKTRTNVNQVASGNFSFVSGRRNRATGIASSATGTDCVASADYAHAEGRQTTASRTAAHSEGYYTFAAGYNSHAEGSATHAVGLNAHAEGQDTWAYGYNTHAENTRSKAFGNATHAEGYATKAFGQQSHSEGRYTVAAAPTSHAEGFNTITTCEFSHAEGYNTRVGYSGVSAAIENSEDTYSLVLSGDYTGRFIVDASVVMWDFTGGTSAIYTMTASIVSVTYDDGPEETTIVIDQELGDRTGCNCAPGSSSVGSHAEGGNTIATGYTSHAEGNNTSATGHSSHAEGRSCAAHGAYSHASGHYSAAPFIGQFSHACGRFLVDADAQYTRFIMRHATLIADGTNFVEVVLPEKFDGLENDKTYGCTLTFVGRQSDGSNSAMYKRHALIQRTSGTVALAGSIQSVGTDIETDAAWDVRLTADNTAKGLKVEVKSNSQDVNWVVVLESVDVGFGVIDG